MESSSLNRRVEEFLRERGALGVGFATVETLAGSPPSADLTHKLPGARSAISFALALDRDHIQSYLAKEERVSHETDLFRTNARSTQLSWELAEMIQQEGHEARGTSSNLRYRRDVDGWETALFPDISHRYIAVVSGLGSFGWSGNVGLEGHGCAIVLGTTLTAAPLEPTPAIPDEEGFCDDCRLCQAACPVEMFEKKEEMSFELGGRTYSYAARKDLLRCQLCCGGYAGLHRSGKWSSWSPGRFEIPDDPRETEAQLRRARALYPSWPSRPGGVELVPGAAEPSGPPPKFYATCGNCALVCTGDKGETGKNVKLLRKSGCVVQRRDQTWAVLPPDEAAEEFSKLDPDTQALYR